MEILLPEDPRNALVVGNKCRRAMSTLQWGLATDRDITELTNIFDDLDEACRYVARQQVARWNDSIEQSDLLNESDRITLADFGVDD